MEVQVALDHVPTTRTSPAHANIGSLLLVGLLGGLGSLASHLLGSGCLDDTDGDGLPHVPDGEPSKGRELSEGLDTHGLAWDQLDDGGVTRLDELGSVLGGLSSTPVNLLQDLGELAGNVRGVAIKHRRVAVGHLRKKGDDTRLASVHKWKGLIVEMFERYGVDRHRLASPHGNTHSLSPCHYWRYSP